MVRIPYINEAENPALTELVARLRSGRRGKLLNLYRLLLHSPPIAAAWFELVNAVRWKTSLSGRLREIVIIRVALLNRAAYAIAQHVPKLALAEGLTVAECEALRDWRSSRLFSEPECAALAYTDAMTQDVAVADSVFAPLRKHFDNRSIVELSVLIGTYNMHTRVLQALEIDLEKSN
jgi:4-carboxymuconolactone decarboxylase